MAANSLLYFLLTAGLTSPPDQSVTTESLYDRNAEWVSLAPTDRPFDQSEDITYGPFDQSEVKTYGPFDQSEVKTYGPFDQSEVKTYGPFEQSEVKTYGPFDQSEDRTYRPNEWPLATEEPRHDAKWITLAPTDTESNEIDWSSGNQLATERPEFRRHKLGKRKCPKREHFTRCLKPCERTCSDFQKPKPCPKSCKRGCVCDAGLVRNKEGKCVPRDQCPKNMMAEDDDDDSHGCPYLYSCDVYCVRNRKGSGSCEGNVCKCSRS